jgi:L,D-transpeptidase ErfK/SrfK
MVTVGTQVVIMNKPYKVGFAENKLFLEAHMPLAEQRLIMGNDTTAAAKLVEAYMNKNPAISVDWHKVTQITEEHLCVPRIIGSYS